MVELMGMMGALIAINLGMLYRLGSMVNEVKHLDTRVAHLEDQVSCLHNSSQPSSAA